MVIPQIHLSLTFKCFVSLQGLIWLVITIIFAFFKKKIKNNKMMGMLKDMNNREMYGVSLVN